MSRNPVSLRMYKVLGANFDDAATKEALGTLSEFYSSPAPFKASLKGKQVARNADYWDDDSEEDTTIPDKTSTIIREGVPGETAAKARKNLRRDVENKLAEGSQNFLAAFGEVNRKLDVLQEHVEAIRLRCEEAQAQLHTTNSACKSLLDRASRLRAQRQTVDNRQSIISLFLSNFTLTEEEEAAMTSRDVPVESRFFSAMDKTEKIREDCRVLMSGADGPTKAGLEIMASTSIQLEQGFEKLFRWCSFEFRQLRREAQLDVTPVMCEAVRRLRQRPELLNEALALLSRTRQSALLSLFLDALTRGGPSGLPRPIELHAHDPMRYVGDMLAWVHQAIAGEREFLEGLFSVSGDGRMVGSVRKFGVGGEEEGWIRELMDTAIEKLCSPLKVRVQQTVRSQESSITLYNIANLLQFYTLTMSRTMSDDAVLTKTLKEMTDVSYKVFFDAIETQGRALTRASLELDKMEVTPPLIILDHAQVLREILTVYESSQSGDQSDDETQGSFRAILDAMIDPAIEMCRTASEEKQRLKPRWDRDVFLINCLTFLQSVIQPFSFTSDKVKQMDDMIEERVMLLIDEHCENVLSDAGLKDAVAACESRDRNEALSHMAATQPAQLQASLRKFSLWLSGLEVVHSPRLADLGVQQLQGRVHHAALRRLAGGYGRLCEEVRKPENRYEAASTLLGGERPFGQVHLVWQIFGLEY